MKIITFSGYKGGVGKSTSAIHLAAFLSARGKTLLVDGDRNSTCLNWASSGLLSFAVLDQNKAAGSIKQYQFVVIDTQASPTKEDLLELAGSSNLLILPTQPNVISLQPMLQTSKDLKGANYRLLITVVPPYPSRVGEELKSDLINNNVPVFEAMIRRSAGIDKAASAGKTLKQLSSRQRLAWLDYEKLGAEVLTILGE